MRALQKYLARHCEPESAALADAVKGHYEHVLIVPAYDEDHAGIATLAQQCRVANALLILIVNAPADAPAASRARTLNLLKQQPDKYVLVVDRVTTPLNPRAGVGLARKLGSDTGLQLIARGVVAQPWLYQTDADVTLPPDYFARAMPANGTAIFPYRHVAAEPALARAIELYDLHLDYYVSGLKFAGSTYAYPSLGSTLAIHADSYAAVHGFPKRNAGEDFHMLNKLNKIAPIEPLAAPQLLISARHSQRVPFGTGPALAKITAQLNKPGHTERDILSYHPAVFELLGQALTELHTFAHTADTAGFSPDIASLLAQLGWSGVATSFTQPSLTPTQRSKVITDWFDALRSLRFIHLGQKLFPDQPLLTTLERLAWPL